MTTDNVQTLLLTACMAVSVVMNGTVSSAKTKEGHPIPPRGWNSYTGYSIAVNEEELLKNIDFLSEHLLPYGYDTVTVDNGWFLSGRGKGISIALDEFGRPIAHEHFFPRGLRSSGGSTLVELQYPRVR
jgi:hypothetical protein